MEYNIDYLSAIVEDAIRALRYPSVASRLYDPIKYTLESGGKRLRPVLALTCFCGLSGCNPQDALHQALAIELFHNFTLLHDDVMDNADLRRGRLTVHRRWNSNVAILSGDAMLTLARQQLAIDARDRIDVLGKCFDSTAMEVYQGQQLDMEFETRTNVSVDEYMQMITLKTGVLLGCACRTGAIMADADEATAEALYNYGVALGLAFQLRDDWLDTFGDPAVFGKAIGGDILNRKKTWLLITALHDEPEELPAILAEDLEDDEMIEQVRNLYIRRNVGDRCRQLADTYTDKAIGCLNDIKMDHRALNFLKILARQASTRNH